MNEVGEFIAPLGEEQVRTLLIDSLCADALDDQVVDGQTQRSMLDLPKEIGNPDSQLGGAIVELKNSTNTYVSSVGSIVKKITDGKGYQGILEILMLLVMLIVGAWYIENIRTRRWQKKEFSTLRSNHPDTWKL
ncbi:MAG: hypothetical protein AB8B97_22830 [Granulosicoccus sp.]